MPPSHLTTIIIVFACDMSSGMVPPDLLPEMDRQIASEKAIRSNEISSWTSAVCFPDGTIYVVVTGYPETKKLLFRGVIGQIPAASLPASPYGSVNYLRGVEATVRTMVENSLR